MAAGRCVLTQRSALLQRSVHVALRSAVALRFCGGVLAPHLAAAAALWLPPAAKEGQGDCDFPLGPPWILLYPLKRRRSAEGLEAAERRVLTRRSAAGANGLCVALRSSVALRLSRRRSCAAFGCGSSRVAASGGQGGPGGLRFLGSALCACAPSVPCGCTAAALQSRCARPARALLGFSFTP